MYLEVGAVVNVPGDFRRRTRSRPGFAWAPVRRRFVNDRGELQPIIPNQSKLFRLIIGFNYFDAISDKVPILF